MKSCLLIAPLVLALLASVAGCSAGGGFPISTEVSFNVGQNYQIDGNGLAEPGTAISPLIPIPPIAVCTLPDRAAIDTMVRNAVGNVVAGLIHIEKLELLEVQVTAREGDFDSLNFLSMYYRPKPILGIEQLPVELGEAASVEGLGAEVALTPPDDVDFLDLIDDMAQNPDPACPTIGVRLAGVVPEVTPVFDVAVRVRVVGRVGG